MNSLKISEGVNEIMKRFLLTLSVLFLLTFSCCSFSNEKDRVQEEVDLSENTESFNVSGSSCKVKINKDKLEISSDNETYIFNGITVQSNNDYAYSEIKEHFKKQYEDGNLSHNNPTELELQFEDEIPKSIAWCEYYYDPELDSFLYSNMEVTSTVEEEEISENTVLKIGSNKSVILDSSSKPQKRYRIIRLVCGFDEQMVEYYIFFG